MKYISVVLGIVSEFLVIDSFAGMVYEIDAVALGNRCDTAGEHPCLRIFGRYGNLATESVDITALVILGIHDKAIHSTTQTGYCKSANN